MRCIIKTTVTVSFVLYGILMLYLLYGQRIAIDTAGSYADQLSQNYNLVPFRTLSDYVDMAINSANPYLREHAIINLVGNVAMFIPLGFFLPCIMHKAREYKNHIIYCALIIIFIEITQLFTLLGSCDIDDLILNILGTSIGYLIIRIAVYAFNRISH